jgi:hypothetical protein
MKKQEVIDSLIEWIAEKNPKFKKSDITLDTPILEKRIITSLQIPDLILYVESLTGTPVSFDNLKPGSFHSISTILDNFFRGDS